MVETLKNYSGVIFFYLALIGMVVLVNVRLNNLSVEDTPVTYAMGD